MASQTTNQASSSEHSDKPEPSTFFKLPPELRLMVYDHHFNTLTRDRKIDLERYHEPGKWPSNDCTDYRNILLVSRESEMKPEIHSRQSTLNTSPSTPTASRPSTAS